MEDWKTRISVLSFNFFNAVENIVFERWLIKNYLILNLTESDFPFDFSTFMNEDALVGKALI